MYLILGEINYLFMIKLYFSEIQIISWTLHISINETLRFRKYMNCWITNSGDLLIVGKICLEPAVPLE